MTANVVPASIDLDAVATALANLAASAPGGASAGRERFTDEVLRWMVEGYALLDRLVAERIDIFSVPGAARLLELNDRVLYGTSPARRHDFAEAIAAASHRFRADYTEGAGAFCDWASVARGSDATRFAAAVFVRIVSAPQLFSEGNQRTATLAASHALLTAGLPPLVVTTANRAEFASAAAAARAVSRDAWNAPIQSWLSRLRVERLLAGSRDPRFLRRDTPALPG